MSFYADSFFSTAQSQIIVHIYHILFVILDASHHTASVEETSTSLENVCNIDLHVSGAAESEYEYALPGGLDTTTIEGKDEEMMDVIRVVKGTTTTDPHSLVH